MVGSSDSREVASLVPRKAVGLAQKMDVERVEKMVHQWVADSVEKTGFETAVKKDVLPVDR